MIGGRYELDRELGRGGMGAVWLGTDVVLGRRVAIKRVGVMPGGSSPDLLRAEREARIAASLSHPHVVGVYDLVHDGDQQWLVMEYVEGSTLAELVRTRGTLPGPEAAAVLAQTASALTAAHAAGIVHRDVKPSNILVRPDGEAKLSDFGIARAEADASLTQTGLVTGSPAYLAPEVASGQIAGPPADVWSLGATLFHALSGHPPYDIGDNVLGALYRIVHEDPPRLEGVGPLGALLEATMVVDPAARWSMPEVERYLREQAGRPPVTGAPLMGAVGGPPGPAGPTEVLPVGDTGTTPAARPTPPTPVPPAATVAAAVPPTATAPVRTGGTRRSGGRSGGGDRRRHVLPAAIAVVLVALVAAIGLLVLGGGDDDVAGPQAPSTSGAPSDGGGSPGSPSSSPTAEATPDAGGMEQFVESYVATAAADPRAGFEQLTPAYQRQSGGFPGYRDNFWGNVVSAGVVGTPEADPASLTVSYDYEYTFRNGRTVTEPVSLQLEFDPSTQTYLIAGAGAT